MNFANCFRLQIAMRVRLVFFVLLGCPALVLVASYTLLALRHHAWNLFPVIIHEEGRYTLTETLLYFRHFVRELPVNTLIATALGILACLHSPLTFHSLDKPGLLSKTRRCAGLAALFLALVVIALTWLQLGFRETGIELAQYRTRDELSEFGSHWRYHLLHIADSVLFCFGLLLMIRGLTGAGSLNYRAVRWISAWAVFFLVLTYFFGSPLRALTDPLYLAHQAREIETHRLLTLCPALGCILLLDQILGGSSMRILPCSRMILQGIFWIALATLIPLWIFWSLRQLDIPSLAHRKTDLWQLAAAHHFEHMLDYFYVALLSAWVYLTGITFSRSFQEPLKAC